MFGQCLILGTDTNQNLYQIKLQRLIILWTQCLNAYFPPVFVSCLLSRGAQLKVKAVVAMGGGLHLVQMDEVDDPMTLVEFEDED